MPAFQTQHQPGFIAGNLYIYWCFSRQYFDLSGIPKLLIQIEFADEQAVIRYLSVADGTH